MSLLSQVSTFWLLFASASLPAAADKRIQPEDSTLPVVNFKFEFPLRDLEAGGQKAKAIDGRGLFIARACSNT